MKRISEKEKKYLKMLREGNTKNLTWRQFYTNLYGDCHWMNTTQYGGDWLDVVMGEIESTPEQKTA